MSEDNEVVGGHTLVREGYEPNGPPGEVTDEFCVDVHSETLSEALVHVGTRAGFELRRTLGPTTCHVVDEPRSFVDAVGACTTILVVEPTPSGARTGMQELAAGNVSAVISDERPNDLCHALKLIRLGWALAPLDLVEAASRMPDLTERQSAIVRAILAGQATHDIAKGLYLSDASVKRELASLFRLFGADNRLELAAFGTTLGFRPRRICP